MIPELCAVACLGVAAHSYLRAGCAMRKADRALRAMDGLRGRLKELELASVARLMGNAVSGRALSPADNVAMRDAGLALGRRLKKHLEARDEELARLLEHLRQTDFRLDGLADELGRNACQVAHLTSQVQHVGGGLIQYTQPHVN